MQAIGILADDFTGAMDSGAQFAAAGLEVCLRFQGLPACPVEILDTASREQAESLAIQVNRQAAQALTGRWLFKKIDSTLRGHVAAEIQAVLDVTGQAKAVICPAAPLQGRLVRAGQVYVHGQPLDQSAFRNDPLYPARSARILDLLAAPAAHLPLEIVRQSSALLVEHLANIPQRLVACDAETGADLLQIARATLLSGCLPCGAFGLARACLEALTPLALTPVQPSPHPPDGRTLVVVGSANAIAHEQIQRLSQHSDCQVVPLGIRPLAVELPACLERLTAWPRVLVLCAEQATTLRTPAWLHFSQQVSAIGLEILRRFRPERLVVVGGETVSALCTLLDAAGVQVQGEVAPGIPWGYLSGGEQPGLPLITKAGGFGSPSALEEILYCKRPDYLVTQVRNKW